MKKEISFGTKPIISNIVASGRFSKEIDISKLYQEVDFIEAEYEPETYPALLIKIIVNGNKRHVTLYKNGKYIITGAKSETEVNDIYCAIIKILKQHSYL